MHYSIEFLLGLLFFFCFRESANVLPFAGSVSINDAGSYLDKLKADLHISEEGYPQKIMPTGDQQTYKLTKDLQKIFPLKYNCRFLPFQVIKIVG